MGQKKTEDIAVEAQTTNGCYLPLDDQTVSAWGGKEGPQEPTITRAEHDQVVADLMKGHADDIANQDSKRKGFALAAAIKFLGEGKEPEKVTAAAKAFYNFLRGAE